jgi:DNA modification methylase
VCFAIELDPKYVDVAVERWQSLSGKKAVNRGCHGFKERLGLRYVTV